MVLVVGFSIEVLGQVTGEVQLGLPQALEFVGCLSHSDLLCLSPKSVGPILCPVRIICACTFKAACVCHHHSWQ
jgi:hypothetical protein